MQASTGCISGIAGQNPLVIAREGGRPSIPETVVIDGEAAAYWVPAFAEDDSGGRRKKRGPPYAFFFTSLTLEKIIPSARSRV
jgi:hypothetical protein